MERRQFLGWMSVGVLASSLPVVLAACNPESADTSTTEESQASESPPVATAPREDGFIAVGTREQLTQEGVLIDKTNDIVVLENPDTSTLVALNPRCPHQGCPVDWNADEGNLSCPCHGSIFSVDGSVTKGPAKEDLSPYEFKEEDGTILVKT